MDIPIIFVRKRSLAKRNVPRLTDHHLNPVKRPRPYRQSCGGWTICFTRQLQQKWQLLFSVHLSTMAAANIESGSSGSDLTVKASTGTRASRAITWLVSIAGVVSLVTRLRPSKRTNSASETELDKYKRGPNDPDPFEKLHVKRCESHPSIY